MLSASVFVSDTLCCMISRYGKYITVDVLDIIYQINGSRLDCEEKLRGDKEICRGVAKADIY